MGLSSTSSAKHLPHRAHNSSSTKGAVTMVGLHHVVVGQPVDPPVLATQLDDLILRGLAPTPKEEER